MPATASPAKTRHVEAVVVGGGLNGLAAAVALAGKAVRLPLEVLVIDVADPARQMEAGFDSRSCAIALSSRRMMEALEVWPLVAADAEPMRSIVVSDAGADGRDRPGLLRFEDVPAGGTAAWVIENRHLYQAFLAAAQAAPSIAWRTGTSIERFEFSGGQARLHLSSGEAVTTGLVVAADGRSSPARAAAGIETVGWEYGQSGLVATIAHQHPHHGQAEEHFRPGGPLAVLPLPGNRFSLVWTERHERARALLALPAAAFEAELAALIGGRLGRLSLASERQCWPLRLQVAHSFVGPRLALVGDAAHVVHPIAGLGFNLGLRDAAALADVVADRLRLGLDHGSADGLERYQAWRRLDTAMVALATDGLNRLFAADAEVVRLLRQAGLQAVDRLAPLKDYFVREAAGTVGDLPRLMRGEPA